MSAGGFVAWQKRGFVTSLSPRLHTAARAVLTLNYVNQIHSENIPNKTPTPLAIRISNLPSTGSEELLQLPPCQVSLRVAALCREPLVSAELASLSVIISAARFHAELVEAGIICTASAAAASPVKWSADHPTPRPSSWMPCPPWHVTLHLTAVMSVSRYITRWTPGWCAAIHICCTIQYHHDQGGNWKHPRAVTSGNGVHESRGRVAVVACRT